MFYFIKKETQTLVFYGEYCEIFKSTYFEEHLRIAASKTWKIKVLRTSVLLSWNYLSKYFRNNRPEVFCKKGVLRNFAKFTGKHLCQSLFFDKVAGLRPGTLFKKSLWYRCFPVNFAKFLRTSFFIEHLRWLLLMFHIHSLI